MIAIGAPSPEAPDDFVRERVKGIEPSPKAWEAFILPLNYTREVEMPTYQLTRDGSSGIWISTRQPGRIEIDNVLVRRGRSSMTRFEVSQIKVKCV